MQKDEIKNTITQFKNLQFERKNIAILFKRYKNLHKIGENELEKYGL